jgi:hypothetical protein
MSATVVAASDPARLTLPGVPWLAVAIDGDGGTITIGSAEVPVHVEAPHDGVGASIDVDPEQLTLAAVGDAARQAGASDPLEALPQTLASFLGGLAVAHLHVEVAPEDRSLRAFTLEVHATAPWPVIEGRLEMRDLSLSFAYTRDNEAATLEVKGGATVLDCPVQLGVRGPEDGAWVLSLSAGDVPLFDLSRLDQVAGTQLAATVPSQLGDLGGIAVDKLEVTVGGEPAGVSAIDIDVRPTAPWVLVPDRLTIHDVEVALHVASPGDAAERQVTGTVKGTLGLGGVDAPVEASRPKAEDPWTITLGAGDGIALPDPGAIAGLAGGEDVASQLPPGLDELPGLTLSDVAIVLPAQGGVDSVRATLSTSRGLELPEPIGLSLDGLSLTAHVDHPADAAQRAVTLAVAGSATFAGATVEVRLERTPGEEDKAEWKLSGGLAEGSVLSAATIASSYGASLPPQLPDLVLSELELDAVLGGSELSVKAASTTEWTLPVGPDGLGVGALHVELKHHAPDEQGRSFEGTIAGEVHLGGIVVPVSYSTPGGLKLTATVDSIEPFKLLQDACGAVAVRDLALPPELLALSLERVDLEIDAERSELSFAATGPGFKRVQAVVRKGTSWGFAVGIELDDQFKFSSLSADLASLDSVHLPDALIVISSFADEAFVFDELQPIAGTGIERGLLVEGDLDLSGLGADEFLGQSHLDVKAHVGTKLSDLRLEAGIGDVTISNDVVLREATFALIPDPENLYIEISGAVAVTLDDSPLVFIGAAKVLPNGVKLSATMKGTWNEPFHTRGLALSDLALEIGSSFEGIPEIGMTGGLQLGTFAGKLAVDFNTEVPSQSVLIVAFNHLSLMDVVAAFCPPEVRLAIPADASNTLTGIALDDVDLYVVPQNTTIGTIVYDQGLRVGGTLHVAGFTATSKVEIDQDTGIHAEGSLGPVVITDLFSLTGAGGDAGPHLELDLKTTGLPKLMISGQATLLGVTASADVELDDDGFQFHCLGKVFGVFEARIDATGGSLTSGDGFTLHVELHQDFLSDVATRAALALQQAGTAAAGQIADAEQQVRSAQAEVTRLNGSLQGAQADLKARQADADAKIGAAQTDVTNAQQSLGAIVAEMASTRAAIQQQRDAATANIRDTQARVDAAQAQVNTLQGQIDGLKARIDQRNSEIAWWQNWYHGLAWYDQAWGWTRLSAEVGWRGTEVSGLWVSVGAIEASKQTAEGVLQATQQAAAGARAAADSYPIDQDPRMIALAASLQAAQAGLTVAQRVLTTAQETANVGIAAAAATVQGLYEQIGNATAALQVVADGLDTLRAGIQDVADVAGYIGAHGLGALLDVRSASFDGSLSATSGGAVTLDADVVFMNQPQHLHLAFDFNDLAAGAKALAHELVPALPA